MTDRHFEASWHQARAAVFTQTKPTPIVKVPLSEAAGRFLAVDIEALSDLPPFAASRIDGWAVSGAGPWKIIDSINAGDIPALELNHGQCVHIATGAALPIGTTACLRDEWSTISDTQVSTTIELEIGDDIRPAGYEANRGEVLVHAGQKITPGILGLIAAAGHNFVEIFRPLSVDVLILGDELVTSGSSGDGKVRDSLGPQLPLWIESLGMQCLSVSHTQDTLDAHIEALAQSTADVIITSGGTAAGPVDFLHEAISQRGGSLLIDAVKVRPGYHQLFGHIGEQAIIGLPGNPQSAVISLLTLGQPLVAAAYKQQFPAWSEIELAIGIANAGTDSRLVLVAIENGKARPVEFLDSSMLRGFAEADGYCLIPAGGKTPGDVAEFYALP